MLHEPPGACCGPCLACNSPGAAGQYEAVTEPGQRDFEMLWTRHHRRVLGYALRRTDRATAEDVVADTFLTAWRRRAELPSHELPWLLGIARLVLANHGRGQRRRDALTQMLIGHAQSTQPGRADVDHELLHAIATLSPDDREALILVGWDGLRSAEAARVLDCKPAAFRVWLMRARRRLRAALAQPADSTHATTVEPESTP
jgi:RNA polymerase sigma factor (sigma-70 family)